MHCLMASGTQRNQIEFIIRARLTTQLFVVDLQICSRTPELTSPAVSFNDLPAEFLV